MKPCACRGEIVRQIGEALREYKEPLENWSLMKWEKVAGRLWRSAGND
jgi:hypothetical protein